MFFLARGLPAILLFAFWVYCILDVIMSDETLVRNLPKSTWLLLVIILPDIGGIVWLAIGRPERAGFRPGDPTSRPSPTRTTSASDFGPPPRRSSTLGFLAPDDDPDFLKDLGAKGAHPAAGAQSLDDEESARLEAWEAELQRREDELRRREEGTG